MISYRQADLRDRLPKANVPDMIGQIYIVQENDEQDNEVWGIRAPTFSVYGTVKELVIKAMEDCGFKDTDLHGFACEIPPSGYIDAVYNKLLDTLPKYGLYVQDAFLREGNIRIEYRTRQ